jgi:peptidoglycan/xylan/chitin deacetylase (PgdA/CDA1 family)
VLLQTPGHRGKAAAAAWRLPAWLRAWLRAAAPLAAALGLAACGTAVKAPPPAATEADTRPVATPANAEVWPQATGDVAGRSERLLVYLPREHDTPEGIAARFLGDADQAWQIAEANDQRWSFNAGEPVIVPLVPRSPLGVTADGVQTVTVLCYHRLATTASKMAVLPEQFEAQLDWLASQRYRVIRLPELAEFLAGRKQLPQRSVVITFDDGYESVFRYALPLLRKHGFPATLFMYTDFIGARDALGWPQLEALARSGLVDIQAHSKTHRNLALPRAGETEADYLKSVDLELRQARTVLERQLGAAGVQVRYFAYPYGAANDAVVKAIERGQYLLGLTVSPGGNGFYAHPLLLRRTMIFGDYGLDDFKARLQTQRSPSR